MKKRLLPLVLALVLCLGLTVPALAAEAAIEEAIPCELIVAGDFSEGLAAVQTESDGSLGFMDKTGKVVIDCVYEGVNDFSEGLAAVTRNDKRGYIDKNGKEVIPCKYDYAGDFFEGLALVGMDGKYGFIDQTDKEVVSCKYDGGGRFSEGLAPVLQDDKWGFINAEGEEVIPCKYADVGRFSQGLAAVELNGKWGYIDETGKEAVSCKYASADAFFEGLAMVEKNGKYGFIDQTGKEVISCKYDSAGYFSESLALVMQNDKWGFIDQTGKLVIPCKYDDAWQFSEGFAPVMRVIDEYVAWGYIDKTGNEVVPCTIDEAGRYIDAAIISDGMARVAQLEKAEDEEDAYYKRYGYLAVNSGEEEPAAAEVTAEVSGWAKELVDGAAANGLIADGLGDDYRVDITRAQFAAVSVKLYEAMSGETAPAAGDSPFTDTSDPAVIQAAALGFVGGVGGGKFEPDSLVTREQAATMLSRVYTKLGGEIPAVEATDFADDDAVSGYAKDAVSFMFSKEIVGGVGSNKFDPQGSASIEQALVIALRMFEKLK